VLGGLSHWQGFLKGNAWCLLGKGDSFPRVRSLGKIFLYLTVVLLGGALVAPQVWHLLQKLPVGCLGGLVDEVRGMPFHRYLSRSLQVTAVVMLWPLLRSLRIRSFEEFGLFRNPCPFRDLGAGVSAGLLCALFLEPALLLSGAFGLHAPLSLSILHILPRILLTAVAVATMEEFLFRGVVLGFFRQVMNPSIAIFFSSVIFAAVHFLNLPSSSTVETPEWWSGITLICSLWNALPAWPILGWAFASLFAAGMILGWMTMRTGSLWAAIGLHGTWIMSQQLFNTIAGFQVQPAGGFLPYFGSPQCNGMVPVGLVPLSTLLLSGLFVVLLLRKRPSPPWYPNSCRL